MTIEELVGIYSVIGRNQEETESTYKGTLSLALDVNNRIQAKWLINNEQKQYGTGFFKNNILVINFYYFGDNQTKYKGVVVYKVLTTDILEGFWSEKYGDPNFLGEERCFRQEQKTQMLS